MNTVYALTAGFLLDCVLGDPHFLPHPVRLLGRFIIWMERLLRKAFNAGAGRAGKGACLTAGAVLVLIVLSGTGIVTKGILMLAYRVSRLAGIAAESILCYYLLAARSLKTESMAVYHELEHKAMDGAREKLSMIVGRDTHCLDEEGIVRAAVETVAENASDGVAAPMFYVALGGPVLGWMYKAVNTMDSMVGYKNEAYLYFGRAAAKLDDVCNFIPSRISALLMIAAAALAGLDWKEAWRIFRRDRFCHASPNSAQTEAVCAGALGVRLAGDASYFGNMVHKPYIGDDRRGIEAEDIRRANRLMYMAVWGMMALSCAVRAAVWGMLMSIPLF